MSETINVFVGGAMVGTATSTTEGFSVGRNYFANSGLAYTAKTADEKKIVLRDAKTGMEKGSTYYS